MKKILLLTIFFTLGIHADQITLKNGATLPGEILKIHEKVITFKTDFAGTIEVQLSKVASFQTTEKRNLEFDGRKTMVGLVTYANKQYVIKPIKKVNEEDFKKSETAPEEEKKTTEVKNKAPSILTSDFKNLWPLGEKHPNYVAPIDPWKYEIALDATKETGNTDEDNYEGYIKANYEKDGTVFTSFLEWDIANNRGENTDEEYIAGADYETPLTLDHLHAWYGRLRWEKNRFDDLKGRYTSATGYSYYVLRNPKSKTLRLRAGLAYRIERFNKDNDLDNEKFGADLQFLFRHNLGQWGIWSFESLYTPIFEDPKEDYIYFLHLSYELPFEITDNMTLSLKTGAKREYTSQPSDESEKDDNEIYFQLVLSF